MPMLDGPRSENICWIVVWVGLLILLALLALRFMPKSEKKRDFLQKGPSPGKLAVSEALAKSSLAGDRFGSSTDNKEDGEYDHLLGDGGILRSRSYMRDTLDKPLYSQHIDSSAPGVPGAVVGRSQKGKNMYYNYEGAAISAMAAYAPPDSDKSGSLGSDSNFDSPYSQNRAPFTKAHGLITSGWSDSGIRIAHSAVNGGEQTNATIESSN